MTIAYNHKINVILKKKIVVKLIKPDEVYCSCILSGDEFIITHACNLETIPVHCIFPSSEP